MKKDIQLIVIGIAIGIGLCSMSMFFLAWFDNRSTPTLVPTSTFIISTSTHTPTTIPTKTSTLSNTPFPTSLVVNSSPTIKVTLTPLPTYTKPSIVDVDWKDFVTYPEKYYGQTVRISGKILNVDNSKYLTMTVGDYTVFNDVVDVSSSVPFDNFYEDDRIIVTGTVKESCGELFSIADAFICNATIEKK